MKLKMKKINCNYAKIMEEDSFVSSIKPFENVVVETINAFGDRFDNLADLYKLLKNKNGEWHHHPLTGPIGVYGAKKGDYLRVDIGEIKAYEMAQSLSQSAGVSPQKVDCVGDRGPIIARAEKNFNGEITGIHYNEGIILPYNPMVGMIGTTPESEAVKTGHAFRTGGNLDLPFITEDVSVFLPVEVEGAGLYIGDCHALQGYGELSGVALECSADVELSTSIYSPSLQLENSPIFIVGKEPFSNQYGVGVVGVSSEFNNLNEAVFRAYNSSAEFIDRICPRVNSRSAKNLVGLLGNVMSGQAYSKTSESVAMVFFPEDSLKAIYGGNSNRLLEDIVESIF